MGRYGRPTFQNCQRLYIISKLLSMQTAMGNLELSPSFFIFINSLAYYYSYLIVHR